MRLSTLLSRKNHVGSLVGSILIRLDRWLRSTADLEINGKGSDLVERIADSLIAAAPQLERQLLSKSLQEALLYCTSLTVDLDYAEFKTRLRRHIDRYGRPAVLQRFLSLYFFNSVWFHTGESFRSTALRPDLLVKDMERVERLCHKAVTASWKSFERTRRVLNVSGARELIQDIEQQLRNRLGARLYH